jgi:formaldehyde-activating enzyme involved in methanogenesis
MNIRYFRVDLRFVCSIPAEDTDENFDAFSDVVMNALCDLEAVDAGIIDPDITASISDRTISIVMGIEADSERDADRLFSFNVRAALHAAKCNTAHWPLFKPVSDELPEASKVNFSTA